MTMRNVIFLVLCLSLLFSPALSAQTVDRIIAVVNGEIITQSDVHRVLATLKAEFSSLDEEELTRRLEEARCNILNQMIEEKLILSQAKSAGIEIEDTRIEERLERVKKTFPSEEIFEQALAAEELTLKDLRERFHDQEMMKKAVDYFVRAHIKVDPQELREYYSAHRDEFWEVEKVKVRSILIKVNAAEDETQALQRAEMVYARLKEGEDFAELAKIYSQGSMASEGGELGFIERGQLKEVLDEAIFTLEPGEFTDVLKTSAGFHIFKVEEKKPGRQLNFAEAQALIKDILYQEKFTRAFRRWIEELKEEADIELK